MRRSSISRRTSPLLYHQKDLFDHDQPIPPRSRRSLANGAKRIHLTPKGKGSRSKELYGR